MLGLALSRSMLAQSLQSAQSEQGIVRTPLQSLGPFYPVSEPPEQDNDLIHVNNSSGTAEGEIALISGTVFDATGRPRSNVRVEIWQCDANGRYHHPLDTSERPIDPNFQGFGHFITDAIGSYRFRTIKPVLYPGRAPHIHFKLIAEGLPTLVTQLYIAADPQNAQDSVLNSVRDKRARDSLLVPFRKSAGAEAWTAQFDIVLGAA